jgi:hypothetical protein
LLQIVVVSSNVNTRSSRLLRPLALGEKKAINGELVGN